MTNATDKKNEPKIFQKCTEGNVTVTIFENDYQDKNGNSKTLLKAVPKLSYTAKDGKTAFTNSYSLNQLSDTIKALQRAEHLMLQYKQQQDGDRVFGHTSDQESEQESGY